MNEKKKNKKKSLKRVIKAIQKTIGVIDIAVHFMKEN